MSLLFQARIGLNAAGSRIQLAWSPLQRVGPNWLAHNFESCSNSTEIIMSCCITVSAILRRERIQVRSLIAESIKRFITTADTTRKLCFSINKIWTLNGKIWTLKAF
ncbi:hypothetical protein QL285_020801 [Trifolium repens]|nr:hypothetical protein QL285_020801 [Trifolium repens]